MSDLRQNGKTLLLVCKAYGVPPWLVYDYAPSHWERFVWWFRVRWADYRSGSPQ